MAAIFKCIFLNENVGISLKISQKSVPKVRINNIPALVQILAWPQPGDKPLSEPMMVNSLTHICITWPQWVDKGANLIPNQNINLNHSQIIIINLTSLFITGKYYTMQLSVRPWFSSSYPNDLHQVDPIVIQTNMSIPKSDQYTKSDFNYRTHNNTNCQLETDFQYCPHDHDLWPKYLLDKDDKSITKSCKPIAAFLYLTERCGCDFKCVNFKQNLGINILSIQVKITLEWMPEGLINIGLTWFR